MQQVKTTKNDLTDIMQTLCENYIRNSYLLASRQQNSQETLHNRKISYLSYVMKTAHRVAIFSGMYDYAMLTMKQRAITVARDNNFLIDPKN